MAIKDSFETSDTGLASFLMARDYRVIGASSDNEGRVSFKFAIDGRNVEGDVTSFALRSDDTVSASKMIDAERKLKVLIRNATR